MTNKETMSYLTAPLREVAQHHLHPDETVLTAIYAHHTVLPAPDRGWWSTRYRQVHYPARAFVLTTQRALIVEDPTDRATSTADREYHFASCSLDRVMLFELRSHLLDCALTLTMATPNGPERVTIEYSGVSERAFLAAVACMRALVDGQPLPPSTRPDETYTRERATALTNWHAALAGLELRQVNTVTRYLVAGEHVQEWLSVPTIDESAWWQRLSIGAHEQPPAVLVRTDRQLLLIKEVRRIVRGQITYGNEAWLLPKARLQAARIVSGQRHEPEVQLTVEHIGVADVVRLPVLPELAERVGACHGVPFDARMMSESAGMRPLLLSYRACPSVGFVHQRRTRRPLVSSPADMSVLALPRKRPAGAPRPMLLQGCRVPRLARAWRH